MLSSTPLGRGLPLPLPPPLGSGPGVSRVALDPFGVLLLIYVPFFFIAFSMLSWIDFWSILPPNLAPKMGPNGAENDKKTTQNSIKICMALGTHLGPDLGRFWGRKCINVGTKMRPKMDVNLKSSENQKTIRNANEF